MDDGHAAFVDTGAAPAHPRLMGALAELNLAPEQVDYVFLTHVHLDHAGGAGQLMRALPRARAVLHPRGAPHLVDPAKLIEGTLAVYGEAMYRQLYGEIVPIAAERILVANDGDRISLGSRTFELLDTPGHARHHYCAHDLDHDDIYSGDTFGISYREFDTAAGPFVFPTTTPVQFDPEALKASVDRLMSRRPRRMVLTHFGPVGDLERLSRDLRAAIDEFVRMAGRHADAPDRTARIAGEMFDYLSARLDAHGYAGDERLRHSCSIPTSISTRRGSRSGWHAAATYGPRRLTMDKFKALRIHRDDGRIQARMEQIGLDDLSPGEVVVRVGWSGINYKDALAATGTSPILRRYPLVAGIDLAGEVVSSTDARYRAGQKVLVTGCGLAETHDGGYAEYARLSGDWLIELPPGMSERDAMTLGTAGFTAALAIHRMEQNGQRPDGGPIVVTGASGGVGGLAVNMLAGARLRGRGRERQGRTRSPGCVSSVPRGCCRAREIDLGSRPLEKALWAGAIDNVGGELLTWLTRTVDFWGNIASIGLAGSAELQTTVMPFILRGVSLLGINSVATPRATRLEVWKRIGTDLRPAKLPDRDAGSSTSRPAFGLRRLPRRATSPAGPWCGSARDGVDRSRRNRA